MTETRAKFGDYERKVRSSFSAQGLMRTFAAAIENIEPGRCRITAPIREQCGQQHGFAHAGLTFALGDSSAGFAALSLMEENQEVLTVEMKINLIAPASGGRLVAEGRVVKPGRRLMVVAADVYAETDRVRTHVALLQGTMIPIET